MTAVAMEPRVSPLDPETGIVRWAVDISDEPGEPTIFNCSTKMAETRTFMPVGCFDANECPNGDCTSRLPNTSSRSSTSSK